MDQFHAIANPGPRQPFAHGLATAVRLNDDKDRLDSIEVINVAVFAPIGGARKAKRGNAMGPQGMAVGFSFDQHHVSGLVGFGEPLLAIKANFGPGFPAEAIAHKPEPQPDRNLFTLSPIIGNSQCRLVAVVACVTPRDLRKSIGNAFTLAYSSRVSPRFLFLSRVRWPGRRFLGLGMGWRTFSVGELHVQPPAPACR